MNPFEKRAETAAKILACYSNVADCIPQPIKKAEERKPLGQVRKEVKVSKDDLKKAEQGINEAMQLIKGGDQSLKSKKDRAKAIVCKAFDEDLITAEEFLDTIRKLDK